jgi:hypothetical protein
VRLEGTGGYSDDREPVGTLAAGIGAGDTVLTLPAGVSPGDTLVIEQERIYVLTSAGAVERGVRGTAAAAHGAGAAVYRERYPRPVERAARMVAARYLREAMQAYTVAAGGLEMAGPPLAATYPVIRDLLAPYRRQPVGVG